MKIDKTQVARVWDVEVDKDGKKIVRAKLSTYEGKDYDGNPKYSSWLARFVGDCFKNAKHLEDKDLITLEAAKIESSYDKETKKNYTGVTVFDFVMYEPEDEEEEEKPRKKSKK